MLAQTVAGLRHFGVIDSLRSTLQQNYLIEFFPPPPPYPSCSLSPAIFPLRLLLPTYTSCVILFSHDRTDLISHLITRLFNYFKVKYAVSDWSVNGEPCSALTAVSWSSPGTYPSRWCLPWYPLTNLLPVTKKEKYRKRRRVNAYD